MQPIQYGMFIMPYHDPNKPIVQCLDEDLELVVKAEQLGFTEFWIGEHHTLKYEPIVMPEIFIARALGETNTIRLGPAPVCLNYHNPGHVASRLAFLDHLSKGRLNLCFGPGAVPADQEFYGTHGKESNERVLEAIDMILQLWSSDPPYEINGKYWNIRLKDAVDQEALTGYVHKPLQRPHPPIAMPGMSRDSGSMKIAGRYGFQPFGHSMVTTNVLADLWKTYEQAALDAGRQPDRAAAKFARAIFVADTTEEARRKARHNSIGGSFEYNGLLLDKSPFGRQIYKRDLSMSNADCNMDFLMEEQIIAGDVDEVVRRLLLMYEETGHFGTLVNMSYDFEDDKQGWFHSMELFANEVMPAVNKAIGAVTV